MIEALYIADTTNTLVFEYLISRSAPSFKSLWGVIETNIPTTGSELEFDSVVPFIKINQDYFVCYQNTSSLTVYVLCSTEQNPNPLGPIVFVTRLLAAMEDYFGSPLAVSKIDANNDTLYLLINEMVDDGIPVVTDANQLRDLIPFKSLLSRILTTTNELASAKSLGALAGSMSSTKSGPSFGGAGSGTLHGNGSLHSGSNSGSSFGTGSGLSFASATPWRKSNVKYTNNEMFVDIIETINVILRPTRNSSKASKLASSSSAFYSTSGLQGGGTSKLVAVTGTIDGQIEFTSHLTGIPDLQLSLQTPYGVEISGTSFHQCIRSPLERWSSKNGGVLSFIPADGKSTLMTYQVDLSASNNTSQIGLVDVEFTTGLGAHQNEFEVKLFIKQNKGTTKIEDFTVQVVCPALTEEPSSTIRSGRVTHGDFSYRGHGVGEWNLRGLSTGVQPILRGSITGGALDSDDDLILSKESDVDRGSAASTPTNSSQAPGSTALQPEYLRLSYNTKGHVPSGLKVESLKLISARGMGEAVKPYKGVKYITRTGEYIVRR
ncbi:AP-3 complex subunit mu [[Candida] anglica]|uniref:AP-3 complex subunit mu n=1 Tax=[Candida] anglica TaxID=148631 RepID=A0ABP0EF91_9ASCO